MKGEKTVGTMAATRHRWVRNIPPGSGNLGTRISVTALTVTALTMFALSASAPAGAAEPVPDTDAALHPDPRTFSIFERRHDQPLGPHYSEFSRAQRTPEEYKANQRLSPEDMAALLQNEYGRGSMLGRSAATVAGLAQFAERGTQMPLDTVNLFTDGFVDRTCRALRMDWKPDLSLRSRVRSNGVGVGIRTRW